MLIKALASVCFALASLAAWATDAAVAQKDQLKRETAALVASADFASIEKLVEQETRAQSRFADGMWRSSLRYSFFDEALRKQVQGEEAWGEVMSRLRKLATKRAGAWMLYEEAIYAHAWAIRGPGFAIDVTPEGAEGFHRLMTEARNVLEDHKAALAKNPSWYSFRMSTSTELGEPDSQSAALFNEGIKAHPTYHAIYFARMRYLTPIWHGSRDRLFEFLDQVAALGGKTAAEGMYARLLWYLEDSGSYLIHDSRVDREAMRSSARALAKAAPDAWNTQKLFFFACELSDKPLATELIPLLRDPPIKSLLFNNVPVYESCIDWAEGRLPMFLMRDHEDGEVKEYLIK